MSSTAARSPAAALRIAELAGNRQLWLRIAAIAVGLLLGLAYLSTQLTPGTDLFQTIWVSTLGTPLGIQQWISLATPLILAGCAVAVARRAGLWNIGVDGQLLVGAWAATGVAFSLPSLPGVLLVPLMLLASLAGGMGWALVPALAQAYLRVSEVVTTLMLNFVAYSWTTYWITGPWKSTEYANVALQTKPIPESTFLPSFTVGGAAIGVSFLIAVGVVAALWLVFRHTHFGFRTHVTGASEEAGRYAGFDTRRARFAAMLLSGAIAGLAGSLVEMSTAHSYAPSLTDNTGYVGIVVAILAAGSMGGVLATGLLLALLQAVGSALRIAGVTSGVVLLLVGLLLICASLAAALPRDGILRRRRRVPPPDAEPSPEAPR
ncbi:MAG: ral nucleoside transport system permease protein [Thermoleophilaceae bacterium]|jgi:simple sugar transport system permease protein|nr:ral nucleoside transport system permease protein [Thermoleophilaceae bacterium]